MKINWNGFLNEAIENYPNESCAFLFSKKPYSAEEEWFVFSVKNISKSPKDSWIPDNKEMATVKNRAVRLGLTKIGNVHTHPSRSATGSLELEEPSEIDLKFARKFNDIIRIIVVVGKSKIYGIGIHDKFGNKIDILLESN